MNMIKIHDFKALTMSQKLQHTQHMGTFLTVTKVSDHVIKLYALGKFYVEVWYDTEKQEMDVTAFDNIEWLAAYIPDIDFSI